MKSPKANEETAIEVRAQNWPQTARSLVICDQETRDKASEALVGIRALREEAEAVFGDLVRKTDEAHKAAVVARKKVDDPLLEAERIVKRLMLGFDGEQERLRLEEQNRLQAEENRRAEVQRQKELKLMERQGASKREIRTVAKQPIIAPTVRVAPIIVSDESSRDNWNVEVTNLGLLIQFVAKTPAYSNMLVPNLVALRAVARAQKAMMKVPGVRVFNDKVLVNKRS